jgi:hypothetical protein
VVRLPILVVYASRNWGPDVSVNTSAHVVALGNGSVLDAHVWFISHAWLLRVVMVWHRAGSRSGARSMEPPNNVNRSDVRFVEARLNH